MRKSTAGLLVVGGLIGAGIMHVIDSLSIRCQAVFQPWLSESDMGDGASVGLTQITAWHWDWSWLVNIQWFIDLNRSIWTFIISIPGAIGNWRLMPLRWLVSHLHLNWSLERPHWWNLPHWWPFPLRVIAIDVPWWLFIFVAALWSLALLIYLWRNGALYFIRRDAKRLINWLRRNKTTEDHETTVHTYQATTALPRHLEWSSTEDPALQPGQRHLDWTADSPPTSQAAPRYYGNSKSALTHSAGGVYSETGVCRCNNCGHQHTRG